MHNDDIICSIACQAMGHASLRKVSAFLHLALFSLVILSEQTCETHFYNPICIIYNAWNEEWVRN